MGTGEGPLADWHENNRFHSISVPSEWGPIWQRDNGGGRDFVSIQLVSPASGDVLIILNRAHIAWCFHSISVPSEWGQELEMLKGVSNYRFHSISVPSEWGLITHRTRMTQAVLVSIQLVSPASGDVDR